MADTNIPQSNKPESSRNSKRSKKKVTPARACAYDILSTVNKRDAFARDVIDNSIQASKLSVQDRAFATRIVLGCVQMQGTLDEIINHALKSPKDVRPNVRDALRISAYEIIFLEKSAHAAVDQGVELVRMVEPKAAGLANAVLRKIVALKDDFPFGDVEADRAAFSRSVGFPQWLYELFAADMTDGVARQFMAASNEPAPVFIAVNAARATDAEIVDEFARAKVKLFPAGINSMRLPGAFLVNDSKILTDPRIKKLFSEGKIIVADAASQFVALLVAGVSKGASLLEIGAGRATKTILLQNYSLRKTGAQIEDYYCLDNIDFKTKLLTERTQIYKTHVTKAVKADACDLSDTFNNKLFGTVFIDSPCSGLGTLRRHPEIRWRITPGSLEAQTIRQQQILESASKCVAPGGVLAYATCSPICAEDEKVCESFIQSSAGSDFETIKISGKDYLKTNMLEDKCDAHFLCLMKRKN